MMESGIEKDLVDQTFKTIRENKTPLHGQSGKGTPKEIEDGLAKLSNYWLSKNVSFADKSNELIRAFMKEFHLGVDCSGFVFNIFRMSLEENVEEFLQMLAWTNLNNKTVMQASCKVFNSSQLQDVAKLEDAQPLDIVLRGNSHIGIILEQDSKLFLADSSMEMDGVWLSPLDIKGKTVPGRNEWEKAFGMSNVQVKRVPLFES
jgi:hypothetical protein